MNENKPPDLNYYAPPRQKRPLWSFKDGSFEIRGDVFIMLAVALGGCLLAWMIWVTAVRLWM